MKRTEEAAAECTTFTIVTRICLRTPARRYRIRSPPLRFALCTAMRRTSCVTLPLRSAKRPLQSYVQKSTDSLRLPQFRNAQYVDALARSPFLVQGHAIQRTPVPTPATRNARCARDSPRLPHETRAEQRQNAPSPTLPRETYAEKPQDARCLTPAARIHPPAPIACACHAKGCPATRQFHTSPAPRPPRQTHAPRAIPHAHHANARPPSLTAHILDNSPRLPSAAHSHNSPGLPRNHRHAQRDSCAANPNGAAPAHLRARGIWRMSAAMRCERDPAGIQPPSF